MTDLQREISNDRRNQLNPYVWRDKYYNFDIVTNTARNRIETNSVVVSNAPFMLDRITYRTIFLQDSTPPYPYVYNEVRFAVNTNYLNNDFADSRLLFGYADNGDKVLPLVERWLCKPGDSLVIEQRQAPRSAGGEFTFNYTQQWVFHGFEKWNQ